MEELKKLGSAPANKLSPQTAAQFFGLFLSGYSTYQIYKQNPNFGVNGWGLIVKARIEYDWDIEREKYIKSLMDQTRQAAEKSVLEGIQFASDGMAVFHKMMGGRFRRYLQTGNEEELGDFKDMTFRSYREFVDLLQKLTGTDGKKSTGVEHTPVVRTVEDGPAGANLEPATDTPMSAAQAMQMLGMLVKETK